MMSCGSHATVLRCVRVVAPPSRLHRGGRSDKTARVEDNVGTISLLLLGGEDKRTVRNVKHLHYSLDR